MKTPVIMKRSVILTILALSCYLLASAQVKSTDDMQVLTFKCQGIERSYYLYLPEDMPEGAPLVFYLHGYGAKLRHQKSFYKLADKEKFAVCVPWAAVDPEGKHGWNVGYNVQKGYKVDDVKFLMKLTKHLHKTCGTSDENVFVTGHSNGGEMCYLIAYTHPEFFRAVAPLSGLTMKWMYDSMKPKKAIPLLEIHGTADDTSLWNGVSDDEYWGPYLSVPLAVSNWAIAAHCDHEVTEELPLGAPDAHKVIAHKYESDDNGGVKVQLYEIIGCGHGLNQVDCNFPQIVWDFFKQYIR